jgi:hypothetical protein
MAEPRQRSTEFSASVNRLTINGKEVTGGKKVVALLFLAPVFGLLAFVLFPIMFLVLLVLAVSIGLISLFVR